MKTGSISLVKKTFLYGLGVAGGKFLFVILVPILTYFMTKEEIGKYDLILTTVTFLCPLLSLYIEQSVLRWLLDNKCNQIQQVITTSLVTIFINIIIFSAIYWVLCSYVKFDYQIHIYFFIICNVFFPFCQCILRGLKKNSFYVFINILNAFLFVSFSILFLVFFNLKVEGVLLAQILSITISVIVFAIKVNVFSFLSLKVIDKSLNRSLIKYSFPLLPNFLSWWGMSSINKYIILFFLGVSANGLFAISQRIASLLIIINSCFYLAWVEDSIIKFQTQEKDEYFSSTFDKYSTIFLSSVIIITSLVKRFVRLFLDSSFHEVWKIIPILLLGVAFSSFSGFVGTVYICNKNTLRLFFTTSYGVIATVGIGSLIIHWYGIMGIAIAEMFGYVFVFYLRIIKTKNDIKWRINYIKMLLLLSVFSIYYLLLFLDNIYVEMVAFILSLLLFYTLNKGIFYYGIRGLRKLKML